MVRGKTMRRRAKDTSPILEISCMKALLAITLEAARKNKVKKLLIRNMLIWRCLTKWRQQFRGWPKKALRVRELR